MPEDSGIVQQFEKRYESAPDDEYRALQQSERYLKGLAAASGGTYRWCRKPPP